MQATGIPGFIPNLYTNATQVGDMLEVPLPLLNNAYYNSLLSDTSVSAKATKMLVNPSDELVNRVRMMLESAEPLNLKLKGVLHQNKDSTVNQPTLVKKLISEPQLFQNKLKNVSVASSALVTLAPHSPNQLNIINNNHHLSPGKIASSPHRTQLNSQMSQQAFDEKQRQLQQYHDKLQPQQVNSDQGLRTFKKKRAENGGEVQKLMKQSSNDPLRKFKELIEELYQHFDDTASAQDEKENNRASTTPSSSLSSLKVIITQLSSEVTKLRVENKLEKGAKELKRLLIVLSRHVISPSAEINLRITDKACLSSVIEQVGVALEASLIALQIMTSEGQPKAVSCIEEVQDNVFKMAKFQLTHSVIPALEEADSLDDLCDETKAALQKAEGKARKNKNQTNKKRLGSLIQKLTEILERVTVYVSKFKPTDLLIEHVVSMTIPIFFVTGLGQMQLNAMNALRAIFSKYPDQRSCILQDISSSWIKLPAGKRELQHREYKTYDSSIQMVTALVLQLLQSCVSLSSVSSSSSSSIDLEPSSTDTLTILGEEHQRSPYAEAKQLSHQFAAHFLHKCAKNPTEDDYRPIVKSFVRDLLTVLSSPEWPAAETLLEATYKTLAQDKKDYPVKIKSFFLGLLGTVAAKTHKEQMSAKKDYGFFSASPSSLNDGDNFICSACDETTSQDSGRFAVNCSRCKRCFHESCVGFEAEDEEESAPWFCDFCSIYFETSKRLSESKRKHENNTKDDMEMDVPSYDKDEEEREMDSQDHEDVLRQMVVNYLNEEAKNDASTFNSRQFIIVQWLYGGDETMDDKTIQLYQTLWGLSSPSSSASSSGVASREVVMKIVRYLAAQRSLIRDSFKKIMTQLGSVVRSESPSSRAKALKALAEIAHADPSVLSEDSVMACIKNRTRDFKVSVREAAVDLIGTFMLGKERLEDMKKGLQEEYLNIIKERAGDTGLSVRKRVVNILKEFCLRYPNSPYNTSIFKKLACRLSDEDSVKKNVLELFEKCWFSQAPQPKRLKSSAEQFSESLRETAAQIVAVMESNASTGWFVNLLEELMKRKNSQQVEKICSGLCQCLVDSCIKAGPSQLLASLVTLGAICKVAPHLMILHIKTISVYLLCSINDVKNDSGRITDTVVQMLVQVLPTIEAPESDFLQRVESGLLSVVAKVNFAVLPNAVKCVCVLSEEVTKRLQYIDDLLSHPLIKLEETKEEFKRNPNVKWAEERKRTLSRSLLIVSLLARHHDFDSRPAPKIGGLRLEKGKVLQRIFELCKHFAQMKDEDIRLVAVQALGHIYIRNYKLILQSNDIISRILTGKNIDPKLQAQVLNNISEFLREDKARRKALHGGGNKTGSGNKKNSDEVDSVSVVNKYLNDILSIVIHPSQEIRAAGFSALDCIIRQGLINPQRCVGYVLAFGTDPDINISTKAQQLFEYLHLNQHQFVMQQLCDGLKLAMKLQQVADKTCHGMVFRDGGWESRFTKYYDANRKPRSERNKFITNILKPFETIDLESAEEIDLNLLKFIAEVLLSLPFSVADEPLFAIHTINCIIAKKAAYFLAELKSLTNGSEKKSAAISKVAKASLSMWLLLLMKRLLKQSYRLSESRCQDYSPTDKSAQTQSVRVDKELVKPEALNSIPFSSVLDSKSWNEKLWEGCYKGFKKAMDEDDGDDYTKLHAPRPTRGRKPGSGAGAKKTAKRKASGRVRDEEVEEEAEEDEVAGSTIPTKKRKTLPRNSKQKATARKNSYGEDDDGDSSSYRDDDYDSS